jgi:hypothetical protein
MCPPRQALVSECLFVLQYEQRLREDDKRRVEGDDLHAGQMSRKLRSKVEGKAHMSGIAVIRTNIDKKIKHSDHSQWDHHRFSIGNGFPY